MKEKKIKNWIREHKKEIALVTIGGVAGVSMTLLGKKAYEDLYLSDDIRSWTILKDDGSVGIKYWKYNIFDKPIKKEDVICWDPDTALAISEELKNFAEKAKNK